MVSIEEIQAAYYMVAATGVLVAAVYYIYNMGQTKKTQDLTLKAQQQQLETRQVQLYMQLYQQLNSKETVRSMVELLNMEWKDYDDFERKYGGESNPENYALRHSAWYLFDGLGYLLREKLVEPKMMYKLVGLEVPWHWKKYRDIIVETRAKVKLVNMYDDFEYLSEAMSKIQLEIDPSWGIPESYVKHVPK